MPTRGLSEQERLCVGGYRALQTDMSDFDALLKSELDRSHNRSVTAHGSPLGQRLGTDGLGRVAPGQQQLLAGFKATRKSRNIEIRRH
jgi:hypothetical protein